MKKKATSGKRYVIPALVCAIVALATVAFYFFAPMASSDEVRYVYIDDDDTFDSVYVKLDTVSHSYSRCAFSMLARNLDYDDNIRTGRYAIEPGVSTLMIFRHMRNGQQSPVKLTIPSVRTIDRLAEELSSRLMINKETILAAMTDQSECQKYGYDTLTIQCMFIPNTYEVYWNISVEKFMNKMKDESARFWNKERTDKAKAMGFTPVQVITLASIVDEETANNGEKPAVAGMYYNRYKSGMPLQADPTIKYAWKRFDLKRIYNKLLFIDSPFNTYRNTGLPPGPIRIPSVAGIDAVLNYAHHNYMYMCAKEDFSGTHNFAVTYAEHLKNAAKYTEALNNRGIK